MKYAWIKKHAAQTPVNRLCCLMDVSRSAYYEWTRRKPTVTEQNDKSLSELVVAAFRKSRSTYGTRRLKRELFEQNRQISRRRIGRLMGEANLACKTKRKFKATTDSRHNLPVAENHLNRQFSVEKPNQIYVGDITYISTQEGWLYLAVVIDLYSRQVVGWSMAEHMKTKLVNDALLMALWKRKPTRGLLWHTDRGSQYASENHRALLEQHGIRQGMSRRGNCWDNAVAESFFHTLKTELIHHQKLETRDQARRLVFEYIEVFYNRERLHSANDYRSPVDFETQQMAA